jgi:hypothetical protein
MHAFLRKGISGAAPASGVLVWKRGLLPEWFVLMMVLLAGFGGVSSAFGQADCTDTATTDVSQTECEALVALYASTNGAGWSDSTNWNTANSSVNSWYGVEVSGGQVTSLSLNSNQFTGNIPQELEKITNLMFLVLDSNQLTGFIPPELGNLTNLKSLIALFK